MPTTRAMRQEHAELVEATTLYIRNVAIDTARAFKAEAARQGLTLGQLLGRMVERMREGDGQ